MALMRKFDGKKYSYVGGDTRKNIVQSVKRNWQKDGYSVRTTSRMSKAFIGKPRKITFIYVRKKR